MGAVGIIVGLIGAAAGILAGLVGGWVGLVLGLVGVSLALLLHLFPAVLITIGIIWLVMGSNPRILTGARVEHGDNARPHSSGSPR
jgi:ABC-type dipeptide/oligopeptide/nickel transport system permease subunit